MSIAVLARQDSKAECGRDRLREIIRDRSLRRGGEFTLSSGEVSEYFFDMKKTMLDPEGANLIASEMLLLNELSKADAIGGLVMGAVPIVSVVCARSHYTDRPLPAFFVRKERKGHGTQQLIDGHLNRDSRVVLVDDVTTTGGSLLKAVEAARAEGCEVDTVVTVVDRLEGARENLAKNGIKLIALFTRADFEN
jgi:orotate phosphoribosyltransferase